MSREPCKPQAHRYRAVDGNQDVVECYRCGHTRPAMYSKSRRAEAAGRQAADARLDALEKVAEAAGRVLATTTYWKPARRILIATGKGKAFSHAANDMAMALAQANEVAAESGEDG